MPLLSFCCLCLLLVLGKWLRVKVRFLQKLYLPASIIAGLLGLFLIQGFRLADRPDLVAPWTAAWPALPGLLINIVFAGLFLGVKVPRLSKVWQQSAPQLAYGQIVAWGQYVVGLGLVLVVLKPLMRVNELFGVLIPVGFEGGHGTAGGLAPTFKDVMGWPEGADFAMAAATAGIVSAIVVGVALINWAARRGVLERELGVLTDMEWAGLYREESRPPAGRQTVRPDSVDALALHLAVLGVAILLGYLIRTTLAWLESYVPALAAEPIFARFPLFPLCMIGGLLVQLVVSRFAKTNVIDHALVQRISGAALDFLVVAAISVIRVEVVMSGLLPFVLIVVGGILWNVFCVMWLARRLLPNAWFERAIAEMGQSMGVTATGLLLLRVVDPEQKTEAHAAFGYKQLLHEPFMGGGLWTSLAVLLVWRHGALPILLVSVGAIAVWLVVWFLLLRPKAL